MKIVIDISKEEYECLKEGILPIYYIVGLVANGEIMEANNDKVN